MTTLVAAWTAARNRLRAAGVDTPAFDARLLIEAGAGVTRTDILTDPHRELPQKLLDRIESFIQRREAREPVAHILGKKAFWTFELAVTPAVLTPRPETELLVTVALENLAPDKDAVVADLGVGSGAIAIAIALERPRAKLAGVDVSEEALAVARFNVAACKLSERVTLEHGDWKMWGQEGRRFDVMVSNPPYVRTGAMSLLAPELAYDPAISLDGGPDGLEAYRAIMPLIRTRLNPDGFFALELGQGQAEAAWALADQAGLRPDGVREDLAGIPRVLFGRQAKPA